jgi:DNA repair protein RadC
MERYTTIRELPPEERPREKLAHWGAASLREYELLAILLRTGTTQMSALQLAEHLLERFGGVRGVMHASVQELAHIKGMGLAKATQIAAAMELGRRVALSQFHERPQIRSPEDVYQLMHMQFLAEKREHFLAVLLDTKNRVLRTETISIGTLDSSLVHPREVYRIVVREGAASWIAVHNHPSGDPTPSPEDIAITNDSKTRANCSASHCSITSSSAMATIPVCASGATFKAKVCYNRGAGKEPYDDEEDSKPVRMFDCDACAEPRADAGHRLLQRDGRQRHDNPCEQSGSGRG